MIRAAIGFADLTRAIATLRPGDAATRAAIASVLGFSIGDLADGAVPDAAPPGPQEDTGQTRIQGPRQAPVDVSGDRAFTVDRRGRREPRRGSGSPAALVTPRVVPLAPGTGESSLLPPPLTPLLAPQWSRAVMSGLARTWVTAGDIDMRRLIDTISRHEPLERVPRRTTATIRNGLQLLVDVGEGMTPFWRDQEALIATARRVIGTEQVAELRFIGSPLAGCWGTASGEVRPYRPPAPGTPVLLLTALNIQRPPVVHDHVPDEEWIVFASLVRRAGGLPTALVPYTSERWPRALRHVLPMICWDRTSDVRSVLRIARARQRRGAWGS